MPGVIRQYTRFATKTIAGGENQTRPTADRPPIDSGEFYGMLRPIENKLKEVI